MSAALSAHEAAIRFVAFAAVFAALAVAESEWPARRRGVTRLARWPANLSLTLADTAMLRFLFPILAMGAALWAQNAHFGLFRVMGAPYWLAFASTLLLLDVVIYAQHVAMHRLAPLWLFHRVHHTDREVDVTTALRFHPGEIALSTTLKTAVVVLLGPPVEAVIVFEIMLNAMAMFNHANLRVPERPERALRRLLVTPAMHRIHHSLKSDETDSNYGFSLSVWDHLFGTYRAQAGQSQYPLGLASYLEAPTNDAVFTMLLPFRGGAMR